MYDMLSSFVAYLITKALTAWFDFLLWQLEFAWGIGSQVVENLHLAETINTALGGLPSDARGVVMYFRIPEAINMIFNAGVAKLVLNWIGW